MGLGLAAMILTKSIRHELLEADGNVVLNEGADDSVGGPAQGEGIF